ncbi:MAG TPA: hypothetical protein DCL77_17160 [Prolixibacteraceae bacterium]|nr:hypothetical protein [Prolixibacteraceae bacterium]
MNFVLFFDGAMVSIVLYPLFFISMPNISEQKIVVICDFSERMKEVILHGVRMAGILNKELCLTAIWKSKEQKPRIQEKLINATHAIKQNVPELRVSSLLIKNSLLDNLGKLTWDYDAVLIVLHQSNIKSGLKAFRESSIAFLFVKGDAPEYLNYKNVLVPLDCRKASKETALWASFFGRFNHSQVHVMYAHETDKEQAGILMKNLNFIKKFLSNLNVAHQEIAGKSSSWGICKETMANAQALKGDVMVFAGSAYISMIDLLIGLPEKRIIQKAGDLPILIINPRKEICMMCD